MEVFTGWHTEAAAAAGTKEYLAPEAAAAVAEAIRFARRWHGDQVRPTGAPYLEHLLEALEILVRGAAVRDVDVLRAAVLHDVVEDTPCTVAQIGAAFGPRVAELVGWVTITETGPGEDRKAVKAAYLKRLADAPRNAKLVKLADRASNVQTLRNLSTAKQREYYAQTVHYIVPLAAIHPWFARWYADWQVDFADLASAANDDS